ncbi:unnamed protein product [Calypogeia fissa]
MLQSYARRRPFPTVVVGLYLSSCFLSSSSLFSFPVFVRWFLFSFSCASRLGTSLLSQLPQRTLLVFRLHFQFRLRVSESVQGFRFPISLALSPRRLSLRFGTALRFGVEGVWRKWWWWLCGRRRAEGVDRSIVWA